MIVASSAHAQTVKLKTTPFPNGTGSIGLAPGWQVTDAYRGSVACTGPGQPIWQLYSSSVVAPTVQFAKLAPTMLAL
ncbi:MAG: hypothetical protein H7145_03455 [Akkermansiaceae bacterium]|nr:hypothetical protein [Armatimonadota bacterium]